MKQLSLPLVLNEQMLLENFIDNTLIEQINHLLNVQKSAIIYIYAQQSVGKTHLLQSFCHLGLDKGLSMAYFDCKQETLNQDLLKEFNGYDWLSIDNIDQADKITQYQLYLLYNARQQHKKTLLISGNTSPNLLDIGLIDLKTRLSLSHIFMLKTLSYEQKKQILQQKIKDQGIILADEIYQYLLTHHSRNLEVLLATLARINETAIEQDKKHNSISIAFVKAVLSQIQ